MFAAGIPAVDYDTAVACVYTIVFVSTVSNITAIFQASLRLLKSCSRLHLFAATIAFFLCNSKIY